MAAAASDKARFFMEQSVPELQEWSRRKIFTQPEITAIASKRSDFEHLINLAGAATPIDYARYATYEMNLDALRKKRCKRLQVKSTGYSGQKKISFILERGLRRFQGDMSLWMQYLSFCRSAKANKKLVEALTTCLRLHPLRWEIWVYAAKFFVEEQADMATGRSYMQRGLRFCKLERRLWLKYAKLEMVYIAKIAARRKILGIDVDRTTKESQVEEDHNADMVTLPVVTAEDLESADQPSDTGNATEVVKINTSPALAGAIPLTIMTSALKAFGHDPLLAEQFFDLFFSFDQVPCTRDMLVRVHTSIRDDSKTHNLYLPILAYCEAQLTLFARVASTPDFPLALGKALEALSIPAHVSEAVQSQYHLRAVLAILPHLADCEDCDASVVEVMTSYLRQNIAAMLGSGAIMTQLKSRLGPRKALLEHYLPKDDGD